MQRLELAVLAPSRGRPQNIMRLSEAVARTTVLPCHIFVRLDDDDSSEYPELANVTYFKGKRIFYAASLNELAEVAKKQGYTHLALLGDDVVPETVGWDKTLMESVLELGVAYGSDGLEHLHGADLPTHVVMPMEMYSRLGWVGMPKLRHLFCDNVWRELGNLTKLNYHSDVKLSHYHRWNKKAADDDTYRQANDKKKREADRQAFEDWKNGDGLREAAEALK